MSKKEAERSMTPDSPPERKRRRGIYLLPNLLTTTALFFGFYAVISANNGDFQTAAISIFIAMVMDGLDGRVARLTNTQSDFGVQYDSLSDMLSFGVAPALVMYQWGLGDVHNLGPAWSRLGWLGAFMYTACAALRLARFNTQVGVADKRYFQGLPSPAAAAVVAGMVWVSHQLGWQDREVAYAGLALTIVAGVLMVSNVRYYSFKEFDFRYRVPFITIVVLVLGLVFASINPPTVLFAAFLLYMVSGPLVTIIRRRQRRASRRSDAGSGPR